MPGGRPSNIDKVVGYRDTDQGPVPVTAFDRIVAALRIGTFLEPAAAAAGCDKHTVYGWLRTGARIIARAATAGLDVDDDTLKLTDHERRCVEFSTAVAEADAAWDVQANTTLDRLARGGMRTTRTTVKQERREVIDEANPQGAPMIEFVEVERSVVTEELAPSAAVLMWRLTRRFPNRYQAAPRELETPFSIDDAAEDIAGELRAYLAGVDDATVKPPKRTRKKSPKAIAPAAPAPDPVEILEAPETPGPSITPGPGPVAPQEAATPDPVPTSPEPETVGRGRARPVIQAGSRGRATGRRR